jgi:hypothetical protein
VLPQHGAFVCCCVLLCAVELRCLVLWSQVTGDGEAAERVMLQSVLRLI